MDDPTQSETKATVREHVREALKKMSAAERATASQQICTLLEQQPEWREAKSILFYAPMPEEPDIWLLLADSIAAGKVVALPRFVPDQKIYEACVVRKHDTDIRAGQFGVREPLDSCAKIELNRLDLVLVPGLAFDLDGRRLGRGKGYYDRLLAQFEGLTCGVAFEQQMVGRIPVEPHDIRLKCILTPKRWHSLTGPRPVLK